MRPSATSESPSQCSARLPAASNPDRDGGHGQCGTGTSPPNPTTDATSSAERQDRDRREQHGGPRASDGPRWPAAAPGARSASRSRAASRHASALQFSQQRDVGQQCRGAAHQRVPRRPHRSPRPAASRGRATAPGRLVEGQGLGRLGGAVPGRAPRGERPARSGSAVSAQATAISPSRSTGTPARAAVSRYPVAAARSALPSAVRVATGSATRSPARRSAASTTSVLRASPASSTPVPRPTTSDAGSPSAAATSAAAGVVLPIPMSPLRSRSAPAAISSRATCSPTASAALRLLRGERVLEVDGARAAAYLERPGALVVHGHVDHPDVYAVRAGQRADPGPTGLEGADHGCG